ncbi:MAG: hypothetical protein DHS20C15_19980 [Planctomycetota bacterium]|nr:MAG: hypothetical protein DHS20C15_19980 [Planctomycetota bacterium]
MVSGMGSLHGKTGWFESSSCKSCANPRGGGGKRRGASAEGQGAHQTQRAARARAVQQAKRAREVRICAKRSPAGAARHLSTLHEGARRFGAAFALPLRELASLRAPSPINPRLETSS